MLAQSGLGSRRTMEQWIREGRVTVNGAVAGLGMRVGPDDQVKVGRRIIRWPRFPRLPRIALYHKPEGEITSRSDPQDRPTVFAKLPRLRGARWIAVGRLDYNTCGLLIFTTSGELANRLAHPRFAIEREYAARTLGQLKPEHIEKLTSGITLDDGPARCLTVEDRGGEGANHWYHLVLSEGRNRVVRRMFEALGVTVSRLMRVRFGPIALPPRLRRGQLAELEAGEIREILGGLGITAAGEREGAPDRAEARNRRRRSSRAR